MLWMLPNVGNRQRLVLEVAESREFKKEPFLQSLKFDFSIYGCDSCIVISVTCVTVVWRRSVSYWVWHTQFTYMKRLWY